MQKQVSLCSEFSASNCKREEEFHEDQLLDFQDSARARLVRQINDQFVLQEKIATERAKKREIRLKQQKEIEAERIQQSDEIRSDRSVKRSFVCLKALLGETVSPEEVSKESLRKYQTKRESPIHERDEEERKHLKDSEEKQNKVKLMLINEKNEIEALNQKRKIHEEEKRLQRQAARIARLNDESNYDAVFYLSDWENQKNRRRLERQQRIDQFQI